MTYKEYEARCKKEMKEKDMELFRAIGNGYINQAILFNAGFTFDEVQLIKKVYNKK